MPILADLERAGVRVDVSLLAAQASRVDRELAELSAEIFELAGETFNIDSPKQLADVLFEKLQLPVLKRTGTTRTAVHRGGSARGAGADRTTCRA